MANSFFSKVARGLVPASAALAACLFITGCETEESRKVYAGQACLDAAQDATAADACLDVIEGIESADAYLIRCQANFVAQGFTGARLADAFQRMKDSSSSGNDPFVQLTSQLVFTNTALSRHTVSEAVKNCTASNVLSLRRMADAANLATSLVTLGGIDPSTINPADPSSYNTIKTTISNLATSNDPAAAAQIGNIAQSMQSSFCNDGSAFEKQEVCTYIEQAESQAGADGDSSAAAIGAKLLDLLHAK